MHKVFILGCGPAGLIAATAAADLGYSVSVLSRKRQSPLWGCQYLHEPIPGTCKVPRVQVAYTLQGNIAGYRRKVYGEEWGGTVSVEALQGAHYAWDLRRAYRALWNRWQDEVIDVPILGGDHAAEFVPDLCKSATVISTIPRSVMCRDRKHNFEVQQVWAMGDSDDQRIPVRPPNPNTILCNGDPDVGWYRVSEVFGYGTIEWPWRNGRRPPFEGVVPVDKPLSTDCTCLPDVHYVGRYGKWEKGYLVHQVHTDVTAILSNLQGRLF